MNVLNWIKQIGMIKRVLNIIPYIALVIVLFLWNKTCNSKKEQENIIEAVNDSLHLTRNNLNQQIASIEVIESGNKDIFIKIRSKDSIIKALQNIVKNTKNIQSGSVFNTQTTNTIIGSTSTVSSDIITKHDTVFVYPTYEYSQANKWQNIKVVMSKDSTFIKDKIFNDFEITETLVRKSLFKKVPTILIKDNNPHTETTALRSWEVKHNVNKSRVFTTGAIIGAVAVMVAKIAIHR